jgi:hypothetical protein
MASYGLINYTDTPPFDGNGVLNYDSIFSTHNALSDEDYRTLLRMAIEFNNSNFSYKEVFALVWKYFDVKLRFECVGNMSMAIFRTVETTPLIDAVLFKKLIPKPTGVQLRIVDYTNPINMMGFSSYDTMGSESHSFGFSSYDNYDTLDGNMLQYQQIT